jgi:peptidyl-prolyl cis-trans isomerase D
MLQRIRDSLQGQKWLAYLVLGALALVFTAWGAYGIVNLSVGGANYAAEAAGQKVSLEDARNAWQQQQAQLQQSFGGRDIPPELRQRFQDQVLESLIRSALLSERTRDLGYRVSDEKLRDAIRSIPAFQIGGTYSADAARAALAQHGLSESAFESEMRTDMLRTQLENGIRGSDFLTPPELARLQALQNEQREVRYAVLSPDKFEGSAPPDDAAIQAYYKAHEAQYMTPESAQLEYAELRLDQLAAQQSVSDADLHAAYDKDKEKGLFGLPEKRHARHILIPIGKDDAAARKQAEEVLAQAKAGKDFGQLAKQYSQDPGSAQKGGDLDWAERKTFVGPFGDALFSMSPGEIRGPVKTQFGYHIIRLDEVQPGKTKTFDEARPELESDLRRDRATDRFGEVQEQLQSKLEQPGADLTALAKEFNLQTGTVQQFLRGTGGAPLGAAQPLQDVVFGDPPLAVGHLSAPVLVGDDRLVIVKVLDHRKPHVKPLAEVRDTIVAALRKQRGTDEALKAAEAARAKLEAGTSFDDVAHALNVSADPARFVGRGDPSIPAQLREVVFNSPKPTAKPLYRVVKLDTGGAAVVAITKLRTDGGEPNKELQKTLAKQEAERNGMGDAAAYVEELRRTADVRKNPKAFE